MKKNKYLDTDNVFLDTSIFEEQNFTNGTKLHGIFHYGRIGVINIHTTTISRMELDNHIKLLKQEGRDVKELKVSYHQRFSIPLACFIFALVGAPLGLSPNRSGSSIGLGLSIIVIFIYYTLMTVGSALGQSGNLSPWLGAWLQNIIFIIVGFGLLYKSYKH